MSKHPGTPAETVLIASGEKGKARDILAAIRTLQTIEHEQRAATAEERQVLGRFAGFGPVALSIFPDPVTGRYKDAGWQALGEDLKSLLSPEEYDSAKRTTFNAFYTSPIVIAAMHQAFGRLGVPGNATVLEPGCGTGNFMSQGPHGMRFVGVELDSISGRVARMLHPQQHIRIENFRDSRLPENRLDAVIGNVPFADLKLDYRGQKLSLHDFFFAKSVDTLKPGGVLALVTSHYTLDKQNAALREYLGSKADFVGAIRLPADAFKREGTAVVTDIVFLRKRADGEAPAHADPDWLQVAPLAIDGVSIPINRYFHNHPEMVLGAWSRKDRLYGGNDGYSVLGNGNLAEQLSVAIRQLPEYAPSPASPEQDKPAVTFTPPPLQAHVGEGSFVVGDDRTIRQVVDGESVPVIYGGTTLTAFGTLTGKRLSALVGLRDRARRVLQSQNEGWPEANRDEARQELNRAYDLFVFTYGPINKTTFGETKDGTVIRRMPNLVKFKEDPDAMLVMSLEEYDDESGELVARYERLRSQKVDPRQDNALAITTDGRKLSLDGRMLSSEAADFPGSKVNALVDNVAGIWDRTTASRGTQMIFADLGVKPTPWGYSVYEELVEKLTARGVPRTQIAAIGDADSDAKKQALFEKVRNGSIRVLLGSTQKMGTGTNVQKRLVALHHLDAPWKPAEVEQREGRILRQGNDNAEVAIYRYVTTGSFDSYMWVRRESRLFDCVAGPQDLDHTCGSVRSSLSTRAPPAMVGYEAVETM